MTESDGNGLGDEGNPSGRKLVATSDCLRIREPILDYFAAASLDRPTQVIRVGGVCADDEDCVF